MLDGFVKIPYLSGSSFLSVTTNGLNFSGIAVFHMQKPAYVNLFLNEEAKQIAIQKCNKNAEDAIQFYRNEKNLKIGVRFNNREILQMVVRLMGWDLSSFNYKIEGVYNEEEQAMFFDLNNVRKTPKKPRKKRNEEENNY